MENEVRDVASLPSVMQVSAYDQILTKHTYDLSQVRDYGKRSRTKHTHLNDVCVFCLSACVLLTYLLRSTQRIKTQVGQRCLEWEVTSTLLVLGRVSPMARKIRGVSTAVLQVMYVFLLSDEIHG